MKKTLIYIFSYILILSIVFYINSEKNNLELIKPLTSKNETNNILKNFHDKEYFYNFNSNFNNFKIEAWTFEDGNLNSKTILNSSLNSNSYTLFLKVTKNKTIINLMEIDNIDDTIIKAIGPGWTFGKYGGVTLPMSKERKIVEKEPIPIFGVFSIDNNSFNSLYDLNNFKNINCKKGLVYTISFYK